MAKTMTVLPTQKKQPVRLKSLADAATGHDTYNFKPSTKMQSKLSSPPRRNPTDASYTLSPASGKGPISIPCLKTEEDFDVVPDMKVRAFNMTTINLSRQPGGLTGPESQST